MKVIAVIAAGGVGTRMGGRLPKQFFTVKGKPILAYTLITFSACADINEIILAAPEGYEKLTEETIEEHHINKVSKITRGGANRQETVYKALIEAGGADIVLIHDAARPFVTQEEIKRAITGARAFGACAVGVPVKDTIKICDREGFVISTPSRDTLWQIQTPQAFLYPVIQRAHEQARLDSYIATDDMELAERIGCPARIIMGSYANIKITTKEDLMFFMLGGDAHNDGDVCSCSADADCGVSGRRGWDNS
ncbi:MAG: 2-C-methyl-D-erythritol 4-phosphate cytidylyltransferase [Clostridiales bacterium]|nr:2-C-methyl-D-erythritol 4-phosphate cytidylyltransferase [Clostridiales bacterium]